MSEETEEGAIATVRYFIDAVNMAYATNDPSYFEDLATDDCGPCNAIASDIQDAVAAKQTYKDYNLSLGKIGTTGESDEGWFGVEIEVIEAAYKLEGTDGTAEQQSSSPKTFSTVFVLDFTGGTWLVRGFVV